MERLNISLKYFIVIVPFISCADLPMRDIDINDPSFTCCIVDRIYHNLDLPREITHSLNRICWRRHSANENEFYLITVSAKELNQGKAVDVPFKGSQAQVTYLSRDKFEFKVFAVTDETWLIVCTFAQTRLSQANTLFNNIYGSIPRQRVSLQSFSATHITKGGSPFAGQTFFYSEIDTENNLTLIFTEEQGRLANPVLIISRGDYNVIDTNIVGYTGTLHLFNDPQSLYVLYFDDEDSTAKFAACFCPLSLV